MKAIRETLMPRAWTVVILLSVGGCLNYLDRIVITTMRASILEAIPMSEAQFGLLTSVFLWTYGILSPFAGYLADKFNRSIVICISVLVWSIVTWMTAFATTFSELLTTRVLMGVSEACFIPAALALISDYHKNTTRSLATGILMVGVMTGSGLGFAGGWIAERYEWSTIFVYLGVFGIAFSIVLALGIKDVKQKTVDALAPKTRIRFLPALQSLFRTKSFILVLFAWGLLGVVAWLVVGWLPTYFLEKFKLSEGMAGLYATAYFYAVALVGLLLGGFWSDRWSRTNPRARVLVPAIGIALGAPCIFLASYSHVLPLVVACFMMYALSKSFIDTNMMPILCLIINSKYRATGYGILNFLACMIGGAGIYVGGILRDRAVDMELIFRFAAFTMILALLLLLMVKIKTKEIEE